MLLLLILILSASYILYSQPYGTYNSIYHTYCTTMNNTVNNLLRTTYNANNVITIAPQNSNEKERSKYRYILLILPNRTPTTEPIVMNCNSIPTTKHIVNPINLSLTINNVNTLSLSAF